MNYLRKGMTVILPNLMDTLFAKGEAGELKIY